MLPHLAQRSCGQHAWSIRAQCSHVAMAGGCCSAWSMRPFFPVFCAKNPATVKPKPGSCGFLCRGVPTKKQRHKCDETSIFFFFMMSFILLTFFDSKVRHCALSVQGTNKGTFGQNSGFYALLYISLFYCTDYKAISFLPSSSSSKKHRGHPYSARDGR